MQRFAAQKAISLALNKKSSYVLAVFILLSIMLYVYCANAAVRTLTKLENTKEEMQILAVKVSEMESENLSLSNGMSISRAKSLGFVEVDSQRFIMERRSGLSIKTN